MNKSQNQLPASLGIFFIEKLLQDKQYFSKQIFCLINFLHTITPCEYSFLQLV